MVRPSLHYLSGGPRILCLLQRLELKHQVKGMLRRLETLLGLWRWVEALVAIQEPALYLERIAATS